MRSFSAVALFTLAVVTECLSAQSDRQHRQRSGPIKRVPVAADIKRDTDFDCPEEFGYYPHPTDCTLYYVCVFGGALLESCTGGLMYSHELQTCDWPRNVGCDGSSAVVGEEELERLNERDPPPPPPPPRRTPPPPPPPRAQPNPVVTSRGQPKFNRDEYEKQQQLYAEVDDVPPAEEFENERQQRVYRGQPSTIGQVQKDRDGYVSQAVNSRTLNTNIIPASIQNSGKIGSFSFGTQVDERRTATATQAPQSYSEDNETVTDSPIDRQLQLDIETNEINADHVTEKTFSRTKRDVDNNNANLTVSNSTTDKISARNDAEMEYFEAEDNSSIDDTEINQDDTERGKRQVRYYLQKGYKNPGKNWENSKPVKFVDFQQYNYNPNNPNTRYITGLNNNKFQDSSRIPSENNVYSTADPFSQYFDNQSQRPFKASLPDLYSQRIPHAPMNVATQIITKSPPISALQNIDNPFTAFAVGGFFNNVQSPKNNPQSQNTYHNQFSAQNVGLVNQGKNPNNHISFHDSSLLPSTVVTGKPVRITTSPRTRPKYRVNNTQNSNINQLPNEEPEHESDRENKKEEINQSPSKDDEYDDEEEDDESIEENSDKDEDDEFYKHDFPEPPIEFTNPRHKFAEIDNPFANPNFDFDAFINKLKDDHYKIVGPSSQPKQNQNIAVKIISQENTSPNTNSGLASSTLNYQGMSTPRPFSVLTDPSGTEGITRPTQPDYSSTTKQPEKFQKIIQVPQQHQQNQHLHQQAYNPNIYTRTHQSAGIPVDAVRPKLKPPNFKDDRQLPITYSFSRPLVSTVKPNQENNKGETQQIFTVTQKPYLYVTGTGAPIIFSTPKQQFFIKPEKYLTLQPHLSATGKPYLISSGKPHNEYISFKQSTSKPLTTLANEQLSALQHYWNNPSTESISFQSTSRPSTVSDIPKLESLFAQAINIAKSTSQTPEKNHSYANVPRESLGATTKAPPKRRPIPKPSPEMNDYYYDDEEEQYYYEPSVKSKYMPSTEVRPQRPPMAQNYQEYDDNSDSEESSVENKPIRTNYRRPVQKLETVTKNHNDVAVVTKAPIKNSNKYVNGKIPIPVLVDYGTPAPNVLVRPEVANYQIHHSHRNRTIHMKIPNRPTSGPFTLRPPKYLNQTTLRPYTVRHRLAKPTTEKESSSQSDNRGTKTRVRGRHPNIVVQMKLTTPRDNHNQETRYTKTRHDDKTNSLEPTESVTPASYSANPRPKMLYNGSQNYSPDHYDPYYAVYDEDGELYKDTDYVQQYNTASLRPAVQQTYRGTPPPARRPVEAYTPRPSQEDYDDALINPQINNQNQYQAPIRHSTRGEGNELGYDHNPSSVKTTIYEATTISTTPSTTSTTSTTTQRSTTALFTEAMTPSRYTTRSSTDEHPAHIPESTSNNPIDGSASIVPSTHSSVINLSSLAKPFEKTDNTFRLKETLTSTEKLTSRHLPRVTNNNNVNEQPGPNESNKKVVSLTTGFSIRRNPNNSNNPYTLTVITRPFDNYNKKRNGYVPEVNSKKDKNNNFDDSSIGLEESVENNDDSNVKSFEEASGSASRRKDASSEIEDDKPIYVRPTRPKVSSRSRSKVVSTPPPTSTTKYYLKTVIKRPAPFSTNEKPGDSTENNINTEALIETGLQNARYNKLNEQPQRTVLNESPRWEHYNDEEESRYKPTDYQSSEEFNDRNYYGNDEITQEFSPSTTTTTLSTPREFVTPNAKTRTVSNKPSYYSYLLDEEIPDQTTEVFSGTVKNIIKAFFDNLGSTPKPNRLEDIVITTTPQISTTTEEKTVNIGFQKKMLKFVGEKPYRTIAPRIQIITEPTVNRFISPSVDTSFTERNQFRKDFSPTTTATSTKTNNPYTYSMSDTTPTMEQSSTKNVPLDAATKEPYVSKFNSFVTEELQSFTSEKPEILKSLKFQNMISQPYDEQAFHHIPSDSDNEVTKTITTENSNATTDLQPRPNVSDKATTTSTTKSTTTVKVQPISTTKSISSLSFPTRASRVNPAIKMAATNPGGGRRSYQSSSKCSSDNSLQANPKCNEIKYQRPASTRGRGSAHYSTLGGDAPQQQPANRGTPPTRSRPTLKPSTAVVTNPNVFVDIYSNPPRRPAPVYPQPTPDKTAAKCRKDVCLLPDCYCGGKDIPGDLPVEQVPQIVLLTFDDSVNDLNKGLYMDLFEKGRVNPNGCPISATFYVSHEWTDYSQVQNLYSAGHEMASHTISHSFGEQFSQKKWNREVGGQREILSAYGGVKLEDVRGMRAPFLSVGGNKMFKMLYDSNFTYDSSLPVYENRPPSWPYTLDYKLFHDCMIPPCPTKSYPGVWEVPMVMWQDLNGGRCSMGDACANPPEAENVYKMILKNFDRHYTTNRAPFGLYYHAAWFTQPHHKEGFIMFLDFINQMQDVWIITNWQALQWVRDPTPISRLNNFQPFQCNYQDRPKKCNNPKVCNLWHKSGVRYMRTCQPCPEIYPWTGKSGIRSSRIDNEIDE